MRIMNEVLKYFIGKFFIVYLDDILVYNHYKEEHIRHLKLVFNKLQKEKLLLNLKKCTFMKTKLLFGFCHIIGRYFLKMDQEKFRAIVKWPTPRSVFEVRIFINFWKVSIAKFIKIKNFSENLCSNYGDLLKEIAL
jgi:hypothetical protein